MLGSKLDASVHLQHELALRMEAQYLIEETILAHLHLFVKSRISVQIKQLLANICHQFLETAALLGHFCAQLVHCQLFEIPLSHEPFEPEVHTTHVVVLVHQLVMTLVVDLYRLQLSELGLLFFVIFL